MVLHHIAYQCIGTEYETLLGAFDKDNATFKKRVGTDRVMATYMSRVRARNHVAAFIKANYKRNDMSMIELTPDFIKEFAVFLATDRGLQKGSIWANCMWLKGVVMRAHYNGLMPRNPFAQFHISPNVKEREFLIEDELKAVMTHEFTDSKLAYIRDLFVFASFTALSFVDIKELTTDDIVEINGEKWILSKRLQEQKAEAEQELKQVKSEIRTDKLKSVATDLYSTMFNQSFSADGAVCSLKEDNEGRFDLRIDGVSHHSWFRRKKDEFMEALGLPTSRSQNRGLKL